MNRLNKNSTSPRSASASSSPSPTRKVSFSSNDVIYPQINNTEEPKKLFERTRSKSSPQLLVRISQNSINDWSINQSATSNSSSINELAQSKNSGKERFHFSMPNDLLPSNSSSERFTHSQINSPGNGTSNNSNSRSTSPLLSNSSPNSLQPLQSYEAPQSPRSRGLSVSLRRLSSKYSNSSSTRSSPENITPRSLDSSQSSPSTSQKIPRNPIQRTIATIHEKLIFQVKGSSSSSSSSVPGTPRENAKEYLLSKLTNEELKNLAKKITLLKNSHQFNNFSTTNQHILIQAECIKYLPPDSDFLEANKLEILINGLQPYLAFEESLVDKTIDLADPQFLDFVNSAAEAAFIKTWEKDSSDVSSVSDVNLDNVKPTFARDFPNSNYCIQDSDGSIKKLETITEFCNFLENHENPNLRLLISNIASQNLGNFFQNALFLRQDKNQQSCSIFRSSQGIPLLPLAVAKATYTFKKLDDGSVDIFYERNSSQEINGIKEMRAKQLTGDLNTIAVQDATLKIQAQIRVNKDGTWNIFNPHVIAQGWI
jgi:hypothetical protein